MNKFTNYVNGMYMLILDWLSSLTMVIIVYLFFFSEMLKLYWIRKVFRYWTDSQCQKTLIYRWLRPCIIYISVITVSKQVKTDLFIALVASGNLHDRLTCRSVAHEMKRLFALQLSHNSQCRDNLHNGYDQYANFQPFLFHRWQIIPCMCGPWFHHVGKN